MARLRRLLCLLLVAGLPAEGGAQVFFASRPQPELAVGPLFIRAAVEPGSRDALVDVLFGLVVPAGRSPLDFEGDLFLLWPGGVAGPAGPPDPRLARLVQSRGLDVVGEGRLPLFAQRHYEVDTDAQPIPGGAPYVTFVGTGGPFGLTPAATYIRIPWNPRLANRAWLIDLRLVAKGLVLPSPATWFARTFWGPRYTVALGFNDVGSPASFSMYFPQRNRVIAVSDPARLVMNFAGADALGLEEIAPRSGQRGRSQSQENTEEVSLFLGPIEGLTPQVLSVRFGYVSRLQSWGPVLVPALFFALGNAAAVLARSCAARIGRSLAGRVELGRRHGGAGRQTGRLIPREALAEIVPGKTTREEILRRWGPASEEREGLSGTQRKSLVYHGRREVPHRGWTLGWLATVGHWDVEDHEVEIALERDVVHDVEARVRRTRRPEQRPG